MTGKDMLQGIQNLDAELIEESEFGTFGRGKARGFGKKKLLLILAAALIMATMTAAAAITRWTATMHPWPRPIRRRWTTVMRRCCT